MYSFELLFDFLTKLYNFIVFKHFFGVKKLKHFFTFSYLYEITFALLTLVYNTKYFFVKYPAT